MTKIKNQSIDAYAEWINSIDWNFFCTFTTGYPLTLKSARRLMERTHKSYSKYLGESTLFWVAEPYELKDGYHTHALLKVPEIATNSKGLLSPRDHRNLIDLYQQMTGNKAVKNDAGKIQWETWNRVELRKFDKRKNAGAYATKYIMKSERGNGDYDILI